MDLIGKKNGEKKEATRMPVQIHVPVDEEVAKKNTVPAPVKPPEPMKKIESGEIDLAESERRKLKIKKAILYSALTLILLSASGWGVMWWLAQTPTQPAPVAPPVVTPQAPTVVTPTPTPSTPTPVPVEPVSQEPTTPGVLPDTALAPLRGALIKFQTSPEIFLIENNGELRVVDQNTTIFENGKKISQINKTLIYQLPDKWANIRRGSQNVSGQVDFDPRVLKLNELLPFIQ